MHIVSGGLGASVISLRNGTTSSDTIYITETGTTGTGKTFNYGIQGVLFSNGVYIQTDSNTASVALTYCKEP